MPASTFLPVAGPVGMIIGIALGALVMLIIGANYHYVIQRTPDSGGAFSFTKKVLGHDHAFLAAWFLALTYVAVIWANATALSLIVDALFDNLFHFGYLFSIAGYEIYFGDLLLPIGALLICGFLAMKSRKGAGIAQSILACTLFIGVVVCFIVAMANHQGGMASFEPHFSPNNGNPFGQVISIVILSPWAFVGFESISHSTSDFRFSRKWSFLIMGVAVLTASVAYIFLTEIAASAVPEGYANWPEYIAHRGELSGAAAYPTFFAMEKAIGGSGLAIIGIAAFAAILTGLIGNFIASGRLLCAMAEDGMLPKWFAYVGKGNSPSHAILFLMLLSLIIPFFGRTAISWIVDVTTLGATLVYGYVSFSTAKVARKEGDRLFMVTGIAGLMISIAFGLYFLVPALWAVEAMSNESYLIFVIWSILGILYFRFLLSKDKAKQFGKSIVVWVSLFFLVMYVTLLWARQLTLKNTSQFLASVEAGEMTIDQVHANMDRIIWISQLAIGTIISIVLICLISIFSVTKKREKEADEERLRAEASSKAKTSFLSNMSHDIRTPMNAIIGYTTLVSKDEGLSEKTKEYLAKIDYSNRYLLSLINDILDLGRIESGRMELECEDGDITMSLQEIHDLFVNQMSEKKIRFDVRCENISEPRVHFDKNKLNRVLLNLLSNALKFTSEGGEVSAVLRQTQVLGERVYFELTVSDTGIGMSEEFASHVFEAYARERSKTVSEIQGTGLGMAITKNFVDLMGGDIDVMTKLGEGTSFVIHLNFLKAQPLPKASENAVHKRMDFTGLRVLLVDDNEINREVGRAILETEGIVISEACDGQEAVDLVMKDPKAFNAILMDIRMPVMNGYEATKAIRAFSQIPIIAMSADAFAEDVHRAHDVGMDGHIAKPIDVKKMLETLEEVFSTKGIDANP